MIEFKNIYKEFEANSVIEDLNLTINSGELFVMVGPSGSGKTTTLKMINRLVSPSAGAILIDGERNDELDLRDFRLHMGYVLQNIALFPNMTICENAAIQLDQLGWSKADQKKRVYELLDQVGLNHEDYAGRYPNELSGGEQQRVGIVRALVTNPNIILMDEPFSALDPLSKHQLQDLVLDLHDKLGTTCIFVTHDMNEALRLGTRIAVMKDGAIQQIGTSEEIVNQPANDFVKSFFDSVETLDNLTADYLVSFGYSQTTIPNNEKFVEVSASTPFTELADIFQKTENIKITDIKDKPYITLTNFLKIIHERVGNK